MKKAVLIIAALVIFTGVAFSQATIGAWGRGVFCVLGGGMEGEEILIAEHASWGWSTRVGVTISATSDNVGFQLDFNGDGGGIGAGDQQKIWVKPIDMLTVTIGRSYDDTLRGNACFGAWDWLRYNVIDGEDAIFSRVGITGQSNIEIALAPAEGAYVFAATNGILGGDAEVSGMEAATKAQFGLGYTISGIGQIRLQYVGEAKYGKPDSGYVNAAFKLTMVEGLLVDLGGFVWTEEDQKTADMKFAVYAKYGMDALTIHVYGDITLFNSDLDLDPAFTIAGGLDYNLEGGLSVNADVRYKSENAYDFDNTMISGMVGLKMGFSNGLIGLGVEVTTGNFASGNNPAVPKENPDDVAFAVPIRLEYWF
jgi:hypothetical protein